MFWNQSKENIWIVGHRGVRAHLPENTLISFQKAIDLKLNGIETDIHMTQDGQLVLHHDDTLERTTTGTGRIEGFRYEELRQLDAGVKFGQEYAGEYIPRLEELLERIEDPSFFLNIEMKDYRPQALEKTIRTLDAYGFADRYVIACFDADVTTLAHEKYGVKTQGFPLHMVKHAGDETESHYYASGIWMKDLTGELVEEYGKKGIESWCWCPDTKEEVRKAIAAGVTLMTVNDPYPALELIRTEERGGREYAKD